MDVYPLDGRRLQKNHAKAVIMTRFAWNAELSKRLLLPNMTMVNTLVISVYDKYFCNQRSRQLALLWCRKRQNKSIQQLTLLYIL